ncbi:MAG: 50S ribosomal protein L25, partial [Pseudomonadales bacterium]|nr:50S ribosomal protein L25 [Pseudomonadales bacterium]
NMTQITISCLPGNLPEYIEVDLQSVEVGQALHMSDVQLPEGVTIPALAQGADYDQVVVSVNINKRAEAEKAADAAESDDAPAAEE